MSGAGQMATDAVGRTPQLPTESVLCLCQCACCTRPCHLIQDLCKCVQACEEAPADKCKQFYLMWAAFEEKHGLARHCFSVFERAVRAVPRSERANIFRVFISKAQALNGIPKVREVYGMACEAEPPYELPDEDVLALALEYAKVECDLQEIDRARCAAVLLLSCPSMGSLRAKFSGVPLLCRWRCDAFV
jgi:hypothetical protein